MSSVVPLPLEGTPTRLFCFRHGEVHPEDRKSLYGQLDVRLSETGYEQSRLTGIAMKRHRFSAVYTSDISRARTVADEIARHQGLRPVQSAALRERHFGHWQGIAWENIKDQYPEEFARYQEDRMTVRVPGGAENFYDVKTRVMAYVQEIVARHPGEVIALTAHSGPCRLILCEAFAMPLSSFFNFEQDYCCLNMIDYYPNGRVRVRTVNSVHHLEKGLNP